VVLDYTGNDFYCDIAIPGRVPLEVVHDDELTLAFHHTKPFWSTHIVAVPRRHIASFTTLTAEDEEDARALLAVVQRIARQVEASEGAAAVLTNLGAYQDSKHLHVHIHSGAQRARNGDGLGRWVE
jgi:histidine triad (HIT) family protein